MGSASDREVAVIAAARPAVGIFLALASSASFALSGVMARAMIDSGWSAGATVTARITLGAAVLLGPGVLALRGRVRSLRDSWNVLLLYGALAVAGCQLAYFYAVTYLQVGVALLIEYTAPVAVLVWMWLRHRQRPGRLTLLGAAIAITGLLLVLDVRGDLSAVGVAWALGAMIGAAAYFVISADERIAVPPLTLAASGLVVGAVLLGAAGAVEILPMSWGTADVVIADHRLPWWLPLVVLGLVTAALAYTLGIAAARRLGSRVMSFVALSEVLFAVVFAWIALGELPTPIQLTGGALIVLGVISVRAGEPAIDGTDPAQRP